MNAAIGVTLALLITTGMILLIVRAITRDRRRIRLAYEGAAAQVGGRYERGRIVGELDAWSYVLSNRVSYSDARLIVSIPVPIEGQLHVDYHAARAKGLDEPGFWDLARIHSEENLELTDAIDGLRAEIAALDWVEIRVDKGQLGFAWLGDGRAAVHRVYDPESLVLAIRTGVRVAGALAAARCASAPAD